MILISNKISIQNEYKIVLPIPIEASHFFDEFVD